jgi:hypothetical protein
LLIAFAKSNPKLAISMAGDMRLLSTDFDGTIVSRVSQPILDASCMDLIGDLQAAGVIWAITLSLRANAMSFGRVPMARSGRPLAIGTSGARAITPSSSHPLHQFSPRWSIL